MCHCSKDYSQARKRSRGAVIIAVLGFVILLGSMMVVYLDDAVGRIKYHGLHHGREDLRSIAYSSLDITLAVMRVYSDYDKQIIGPEQGWGDPLGFAGIDFGEGTKVNVRFIDESGKYGIRKILDDEGKFFKLLLEYMGIHESTAEDLNVCLLDWMDADEEARVDGFDGEDYEDKDPPYRSSNAPIQSWDELKLIEGFREVFWDEKGNPLPLLGVFKDTISLYNTGPININSASDILLETFDEEYGLLDVESVKEFWAGDDEIAGTEDDRLFTDKNKSTYFSNKAETQKQFFIFKSSLIKVEIEVIYGDARFLLSTIVQNPEAAQSIARDDETENFELKEKEAQSEHTSGATASQEDSGEELEYPYKILRIVENLKI